MREKLKKQIKFMKNKSYVFTYTDYKVFKNNKNKIVYAPANYNYSEFNLSFNDNNLLKYYPTIVTLFDIELRSTFGEDFNKILLSLDNMEQFLKQSKNYDNFNEFLKSQKISSLDYFIDNKFGEFINKDDKNSLKRYYLILPLNVDTNKYANEYFEFSKIKAINLKKKSILETINSNIKKLNLSLQLEKKKNVYW
jgi:hypothetical protein